MPIGLTTLLPFPFPWSVVPTEPPDLPCFTSLRRVHAEEGKGGGGGAQFVSLKAVEPNHGQFASVPFHTPLAPSQFIGESSSEVGRSIITAAGDGTLGYMEGAGGGGDGGVGSPFGAYSFRNLAAFCGDVNTIRNARCTRRVSHTESTASRMPHNRLNAKGKGVPHVALCAWLPQAYTVFRTILESKMPRNPVCRGCVTGWSGTPWPRVTLPTFDI